LDDLLLIPLGIALAIKMLPSGILAEHCAQVRAFAAEGKPVNRAAAAVVIVVWFSMAALAFYLVARL